ncbi:spermine oxidase-like isoform X2 [Tribolium madens]|uniref:spermine oxidase-like isoform X2 n=1 Tax=Tribolium madens TaxID=41895 RepID=UPI001CF75B6C|nr:spermine oxidase-like isoform X2 [Tribolium madens]
MELFQKIRQWNTKILTFSLRKNLNVTRYHCSSSCCLFAINNSDNSVNKIREGYAGNVRFITRKMASNQPKIIILGAGAAGIAAATRLFENGFNDLTILEAENRVGGRIYSVEFEGRMVDLGGQWCHDLLSSSFNNYSDFTYYLSDGTVVDKNVTDQLLAIARDVFEDEEAARKTSGTFGDYFIKEYTERVSLCADKITEETSGFLLDWFHKLWMCLESAKSWDEVSPIGAYQYKECEGDLYLQWRKIGYKTILDVLMKKIPYSSEALPIDDKILLNKEVNKIVWDFDNVNKVSVYCTDNSIYKCDHLIITASIGALKHLSEHFEPKLPLIKQNAISLTAVGDVKKILLKFSKKWWPENLKGISLVWTETDRENLLKEFPYGPIKDGKSWLEYLYGFYVIDSHPDVLLGWVVGPMVGEVELLSDDVVIDGCMFLLKKFVGGKYDITQPEKILRSKWRNNPHFNGCYSYRCLEAEKKNVTWEDLASPVANSSSKQVLLFAGEATHPIYYSTVHGAIETGYREADRILNLYKSPKLIHRKVAIIGAGMAGLGAATTLQELGCTDFLLIEAQSKPGGRIDTLYLDDNILELGAQWIHGKENPLYELARKHDLLSEIRSEEGLGLYIRDNGEIIDEDIVKRVDFEVGRILEECERFVDAADYPKSVGEYMEASFEEYLTKCHDSDDLKEIKWELFDWHVRFQIIDNSCLNLNQLSAKGWGKYVCLDDQAHFNLKCGYSELVNILVDNLPKKSILLSTPVAEIHRSTQAFEKNRVICDNGAVITCDHLIITPSLGVLKKLKITPRLPQDTFQCIENLGYHGIGKIFLIFDYKWWDVDGFQFVWRKNSIDENSWLRYITGFDPILHGSTVLVGWIGGEGVKVMESLSNEEVGIQCMNLFKRFLPNRIIPNPVKVIRTTWCSNSWILGGYSHITPDCDQLNCGMQKLSEPIFVDGKPRVLMAGEAVHSSHYSTAHGAYESGQQQAELLIEYMMKNSKL